MREVFLMRVRFNEQNISEVRDQSGGVVTKKSGNEAASNKRPRNDQTPSPLPAFKVHYYYAIVIEKQ